MPITSSLFNQPGEKQLPTSFHRTMLLYIGVTFALSDWMLGLFSFSELMLIPVFAGLLFTRQLYVYRQQYKWIVLPAVFLLFNSLIQALTEPLFDHRLALISSIKLIFYIVTVIILYNYIKGNQLSGHFLYMNNLVAMLICLIAVYIAVAIYLEGAIPWRFFVTFTRTGGNVFRRDPLIVRARSIFMEPAHLGYYLNTVLAANLLNRQKIRMPLVFTVVLVGIISFTFSYSAIGVMLMIIGLYIVMEKRANRLRINKKVLLAALLLVLIFTAVFWQSIYITLIERSIRLLQGEESSGYERLVLSWQYVNRDNFWFGNGILHTPPIWNNFAYIQSEFGIIALILISGLILSLAWQNIYLMGVFIMMNFVKGGYLSPAYWFLILIVLLYSTLKEKPVLPGKFGKED